MEAERVKATSLCHEDDVNAVCFADQECNTIVSGSDDSVLLLHDRCGAAFAAALLLARCRFCFAAGAAGASSHWLPDR